MMSNPEPRSSSEPADALVDVTPAVTVESRRALATFRQRFFDHCTEPLRLGRYEIRGSLGHGGNAARYARGLADPGCGAHAPSRRSTLDQAHSAAPSPKT